MNGLIQDLRYALRQLRKNPGFTAIAMLTLALGIGANTAVFTVVNGVLLEPLGFSDPRNLVQLTDAYPQGAVVAMQSNLRTMEIAGYRDGQELNLTGLGEPRRLSGTAVSVNFFSLLGATPELGRVFVAGEDRPGRDNVVVISHQLWEQQFEHRSSAIGQVINLGGSVRQIVGVMPPAFQLASSTSQFWIPLHLDPTRVGDYWGGGFMPIVGRLRPGMTRDMANAELRSMLPQVRQMFPWRMPDELWASSTAVPLQESLVGDIKTKLLVLMGAIALVLLIACANVANLLLTRAATRGKEIALRSALGATRARIFRQLLSESILLSVTGALSGLVVAAEGLAILKVVLPVDTPRLQNVAMDWRVLVFTSLIGIATGLFFGVAPALYTSGLQLVPLLRSAGERSHFTGSLRTHRVFTVAEVALAVVLVVSAGLMVRSLWELSHVNPGFRTESLLSARVTPNENFCRGGRCRSFYNELLERTQALAGVQGAALVNVLPLSGKIDAFAAAIEDHPRDAAEPAPAIFETVVSADYLRVMGIPVLLGRGFTLADMGPQAPPVALITSETAQKYWPNQNPVGKHIKRVWDRDWVTVIGVVGDVNQFSLESRLPDFAEGALYRPYGNGQALSAGSGPLQPAETTLVLRTVANHGAVADALAKICSSINSEVPITEIQTLATVLSRSITAPRSTMTLLSMFALLALALGMVGVYGVISYGVTQRVREIGIRMALGAQRHDVLRRFLMDGGKLVLAGVLTGVAGGLAGTRVISSLLFGVRPTDLLTFVAVPALVVLVALAAIYIPARRAAKVDPMVALRYE